MLDKSLLSDALTKRLDADIESERVAGAILRVFEKGELICDLSRGYADVAKTTPVTDKTIFRLASMTKPVTAVATMILVERGLLSLDEPISNYLPQFNDMRIARVVDGKMVDAGKAKAKITARNILSHSSGIGSGAVAGIQIPAMTDAHRATLDASVNYFAEQPLSFEPDTASEYSGFAAFDVLTKVCEIVSGEDFERFIKREIFDKCNMPDTAFVPTDEQWARLAYMHDYKDGKACVAKTSPGCIFYAIPCTHYVGGAGLVSTMHDYSNFAKMLLSGGGDVLSAESVKEISTPQIPAEIYPGSERWGLSVMVLTDEGGRLPVGSYGWSGTFGTHFWIDPKNEIIAIYMRNSHYDMPANSQTCRTFEKDVYSAMR